MLDYLNENNRNIDMLGLSTSTAATTPNRPQSNNYRIIVRKVYKPHDLNEKKHFCEDIFQELVVGSWSVQYRADCVFEWQKVHGVRGFIFFRVLICGHPITMEYADFAATIGQKERLHCFEVQGAFKGMCIHPCLMWHPF
jgi:hypothetical protein